MNDIKLSPECAVGTLSTAEIIDALLDIAVKAHAVVSHASNVPNVRLTDLCDALGTLEALPYTEISGLDKSGPARARAQLLTLLAHDSAIEGAHVIAKPRSYDDEFVERLLSAVGDLSTDGKRFRSLMWITKMWWEFDDIDANSSLTTEQAVEFENYQRAKVILDKAHNDVDAIVAALDEVVLQGLAPGVTLPGQITENKQ